MTHRGPFQPRTFCDSVKEWSRLPREGVESPSLEGLKKHVDVALQDMVVMG